MVLAAVVAEPTSSHAADLFAREVTRKLDAALQSVVREKNLPSLAVALAVPERGSYRFLGGVADLANRAPRTAAQPFRIASLTKTFTATAVLLLVDEGKIAKTDTLGRWYPGFPNADRITVDDLLRMRSGIAAPSDSEVLLAIYDDPTGPAQTLAQEMATSAVLREKFKPPGSTGVYSNLDYYILGGIVRKVTGADIGVLIRDRIARKLGLSATSYPTDDTLPGGLRGYGWNETTRRFDDKTAFNPAIAGPAGAMVSSLDDLARYVRVICTGGLLKPETQRERLRGQPLRGTTTEYGEGLITGPGACGHSGTIPGFSTDMYYLPTYDATMIVSASRLDRDDALQTLAAQKAVAEALKTLPVR